MGLVYRFDGNIDLRSAFVDPIVDVDLMDATSFSEMVLTVVCFEVLIVDDMTVLRAAN
jgi:hypothetical protein